MIELQGKHNTAKVFTDNIEPSAVAQIIELLSQPFAADCKIRIMPDVHPGAGCTIGTTMTVADKVVPNLVGVDIGCGMETVVLKDTRVELQKLDSVVRERIPSGFDIRKSVHPLAGDIPLSELRCAKHVNLDRASLSIGTLGGGNHFIELGRGERGALHLVVHSGSRNLGKQVAEHYQNLAANTLEAPPGAKINRRLAYVSGALLRDYLHDMALTQRFAGLNRRAIVRDIVKHMGFKVQDSFTTVHNYIEIETMILRKGAISAKAGERVLIPINMRDGSLLCEGLGNADWNFSAPHGAGRLMSRSAAKESVTLAQYKQSMQGIYSSTINKSTIDESPFAYKPIDEILENITETVRVLERITPVYNFKCAE